MIHAVGLQKRYRRVAALDGLNLTVAKGAIYGLIGQNGAGKTTAIRVLATLMRPDGGDAVIGGIDIIRQPTAVRRVLGYVPDFFGVYDSLRVNEYLEFYASLEGIFGSTAVTLRDNLLDLVDLGSKREEYVESLSRGMQQRLCLARALIHDPSVLLLDEPASGLDPIARVEFREILKELGRLGKTILISSHILSELADLCTHVGMMSSGKMVREGTVGEVLRGENRPRYLLQVLREPERAARALEEVALVSGVSLTEDGIRFQSEGGTEAAALALATVVGEGVPVIRFSEIERNLESTFVQLARQGNSSAVTGGVDR